jgi:hypothetical protein
VARADVSSSALDAQSTKAQILSVKCRFRNLSVRFLVAAMLVPNAVEAGDEKAPGVRQESKGYNGQSYIKDGRSYSATKEFMERSGHPKGWPGHIVDFKVGLKDGGTATPDNMEWLTPEERWAKHKPKETKTRPNVSKTRSNGSSANRGWRSWR